MKTRAIIFLLCVFSVLAGITAANIAPRPHVNQGMIDQRLPRQLVLVGDANMVVFYSQDDSGEWKYWSMRAPDTIVIDANYVWPREPNDVNSVLFIKESADGEITLDWGPFDANFIVWDGNEFTFTFPVKTPWNVMFVDVNGYPLSEDPDNFTYYQPSGYFGVGTDRILGQTYANNYIQVYTLLDFHPTLFNTTIGMGTDDTTAGPNNVRIGHNAGVVLDTGLENTLGGKDAGQYLIDANDNTGWGYKVIGGNATIEDAVAATYKFTYISENGSIWGIPVGDGLMTGLDVGGVAVNIGGGITGLPFTGHPFTIGKTIRITGTTNYNASFTVGAGTTANQIQITKAYVAETFDGTELVVKYVSGLTSGGGQMVQDSSGNLYYGSNLNNDDDPNNYYITRIDPDGAITYDYDFFNTSWNPAGSKICRGLAVYKDEVSEYLYLWFEQDYTTDIGYMFKFDIEGEAQVWFAETINWPEYDMDIDADGNAYACADGHLRKFASADGAITTMTSMHGYYDVHVDDTLDVVLTGGFELSGTGANLKARSLDNSAGDKLAVGGYYNFDGINRTYTIDTGCITSNGEYIYVICYTPTCTIYKISWDGFNLAIVDSAAGPTYGVGFYFDLYGNLVVVNTDYITHPTDVLYFYDTDLNYISKIDNMYSLMLNTWAASVGGAWLQGDVVFDGTLGTPGGSNVHRVTALGAYAAANVQEGADDGLYLGTHSGEYNKTDPNRFFLDNLDRGDYPGNQQHGMMYGYFAEDPNDQWLIINADVNFPQDVNIADLTIAGFDTGSVLFTDVNGLVTQDNTNFTFDDTNDVLDVNTVKFSGETASRLLATDSEKVGESTDLNSWVTGTANQITVTDDADGTITLALPQDIHTGATNFTVAGLTVTDSNPPEYPWSTGTTGTFTWDSGYIYICTASNTWRRTALSNWSSGFKLANPDGTYLLNLDDTYMGIP